MGKRQHSESIEVALKIRVARPNCQARTGTGEYYFPCSADHEQDWQPYPVDHTLLCVMTIHTYIHTYNMEKGGLMNRFDIGRCYCL